MVEALPAPIWILAFGLETAAEYVASATNWLVGRPRWHAGNELAG